jgi:DnaJ like chaperone protein
MTARIIATILGLCFGGLPGGIIGFFIGLMLDQSVNKSQKSTGRFQWQATLTQPFMHAVFTLMGYVAKADGQITESEIQVASAAMNQLRLGEKQRHQAMRWFYEGKNHQFNMDHLFHTLRFYHHGPFLRILFTCLNNIAHANGLPSPAQKHILQDIYTRLGISSPEEQAQYQINHSDKAPSLAENYTLLGLKSDADVASIRKAYRRLMNKFHPDKLSSQGATEEQIKEANEKIYAFRQAYEQIMASKGEIV